MGTLFTPRFAPTALSSKGTDCSSEDLQKLVKTYSWVSDTIFAILFLVCIFGFFYIYFFEDQPQHFGSKAVKNGVPRGAPSCPKPL